jgi:hypothetical protein
MPRTSLSPVNAGKDQNHEHSRDFPVDSPRADDRTCFPSCRIPRLSAACIDSTAGEPLRVGAPPPDRSPSAQRICGKISLEAASRDWWSTRGA